MTAAPERFPRVFWFANLTELFERAAYYATASFVVIYLGQLGLGDYWPSTLNSLLWTLIYFLPILSGAIADQITFRRALLIAFVLLTAGYFMMGYPVWLGGAELKPMMEKWTQMMSKPTESHGRAVKNWFRPWARGIEGTTG